MVHETDGQQSQLTMPPDSLPWAVENLRVRISQIADATGLFDALVQSVGEYFCSPDRKRRPLADGRDPRIVEPGQERLLDGTTIVRRRTLDQEDSGEFVVPTEGWTELRNGLEESYRDWQIKLDLGIDGAGGLRDQRARFCTNLTEAWFTELLADLRELKDMRHPSKFGDGSAFWKYGHGALPERAGDLVEKLKRAWLTLADVVPARPGVWTTAQVIAAIGRESVRLHQLPPDMGPSHLRGADLAGFVLIRHWARNRQADGSGRDILLCNWYSPAKSPPEAGDVSWEQHFRAFAPPWTPAAEVRLSESGLQQLDLTMAPAHSGLEVADDYGHVKLEDAEFVFTGQAQRAMAELFKMAAKNDGGIDIARLGTKIGSNSRRFRLDACFRTKEGGTNPGLAALVEVMEGARARIRPEIARKWRAE